MLVFEQLRYSKAMKDKLYLRMNQDTLGLL